MSTKIKVYFLLQHLQIFHGSMLSYRNIFFTFFALSSRACWWQTCQWAVRCSAQRRESSIAKFSQNSREHKSVFPSPCLSIVRNKKWPPFRADGQYKDITKQQQRYERGYQTVASNKPSCHALNVKTWKNNWKLLWTPQRVDRKGRVDVEGPWSLLQLLLSLLIRANSEARGDNCVRSNYN